MLIQFKSLIQVERKWANLVIQTYYRHVSVGYTSTLFERNVERKKTAVCCLLVFERRIICVLLTVCPVSTIWEMYNQFWLSVQWDRSGLEWAWAVSERVWRRYQAHHGTRAPHHQTPLGKNVVVVVTSQIPQQAQFRVGLLGLHHLGLQPVIREHNLSPPGRLGAKL